MIGSIALDDGRRKIDDLSVIPTNTYHQFCNNIYSQNGEDGILDELIKELNLQSGTFCEFGASDGVSSSNILNLIEQHNFTGLLIEANPVSFRKLIENYEKRGISDKVICRLGYVKPDENESLLDTWLDESNMPKDLDVLSIDVDYDDYYIWKSLTQFNPKIVVFEVNSYRDPIFEELPGKPCLDYNYDPLDHKFKSRKAMGCSFYSGLKLGLSKGYIPISFTGNIIFVRKDLVTQLTVFPYIVSDNPDDYLSLYSPFIMWDTTIPMGPVNNISDPTKENINRSHWYSNSVLIMNVAIQQYYFQTGKKYLDLPYLERKMFQIIDDIWNKHSLQLDNELNVSNIDNSSVVDHINIKGESSEDFKKTPLTSNIWLAHVADGEDKEGIGAIAECQLQCFAGSKLLNVNYHHTPFTRIYHYQPYGIDPETWDQQWNDFFSLKQFHQSIDGDYRTIQLDGNFEHLKRFIEIHKNNGKRYLVNLSRTLIINMCDLNVNEMAKILQSNLNRSIKIDEKDQYFDKDAINVAIHLRKYTPTDCDPSPIRELYTPKDFSNYSRLIESIDSLILESPDESIKNPVVTVVYHIYAQGKMEEYTDYNRNKIKISSTSSIKLHIEEHPVISFYHMMMADLLVMTKSSFSYLAHFFSKGLLMQRSKFWHKLRTDVILFSFCDGETEFDSDKLMQMYQRYILVKQLNLQSIYSSNTGKLILPSNCKIKLDVGLSYSAPNSALWLKNLPNRIVFGFEPNRECLACLKKGLGYPGGPNNLKLNPSYIGSTFYLVPCALDDNNDSHTTASPSLDSLPSVSFLYKTFYSTDGDLGASSLYQPVKEKLKMKEIYPVFCCRLKEFFDLIDWNVIKYIEHIKIDAQGNDLRILYSAGDYLKKIVFITVECENESAFYHCNLPNSGNNFNQLKELMNKYGFSLHPSPICDAITGVVKTNASSYGGNYTFVNDGLKHLINMDGLDASHLGC